MKRIMINQLNDYINGKVQIKGWIHRIRKLKSVTFIILRDRTGLVQCVVNNKEINDMDTKLESVVEIIGTVLESKNNLNSFEVSVDKFSIINRSIEELPIEINKENLEVNLDTMLNNRMLSLRHEKVNSIFKIQNIIVGGFREFLNNEDFTEISTPKLVEGVAEGGDRSI